MTQLLRPCTECGELSERSRCVEHRPKDDRASKRSDAKTTAWTKLSIRARRIQPWCSNCGTTANLEADHSPRAWARQDAGKTVRLCDITVLCGRCNVRAGSSQAGTERYARWADADGDLTATTPDFTTTPRGVGDALPHQGHRCKAKLPTDTRYSEYRVPTGRAS